MTETIQQSKKRVKREYREAIFKMLRCVSVVSTAEFGDSVNGVLRAVKELNKYNITPEEAMEWKK